METENIYERLMQIFREEEFEQFLTEDERIELMIILSQTINARMEELIMDAVELWEHEETLGRQL